MGGPRCVCVCVHDSDASSLRSMMDWTMRLPPLRSRGTFIQTSLQWVEATGTWLIGTALVVARNRVVGPPKHGRPENAFLFHPAIIFSRKIDRPIWCTPAPHQKQSPT